MNCYILALPICRWGSKALSVLQWHSEFYLCSETQPGFFTGPTCFHILCSIRKPSFERAFGCQHTFLPTMFFLSFAPLYFSFLFVFVFLFFCICSQIALGGVLRNCFSVREVTVHAFIVCFVVQNTLYGRHFGFVFCICTLLCYCIFVCLAAQHTPLYAIVFIYSWVTWFVMIYDCQ